MLLKNLLRPFAVACALTATFSACSSGTKEGDTNVERGYNKNGPAADSDGVAGGDSATAGLSRDTARTPPARTSTKPPAKPKTATTTASPTNHWLLKA